jgi:hypothetical protein
VHHAEEVTVHRVLTTGHTGCTFTAHQKQTGAIPETHGAADADGSRAQAYDLSAFCCVPRETVSLQSAAMEATGTTVSTRRTFHDTSVCKMPPIIMISNGFGAELIAFCFGEAPLHRPPCHR